ncbi:MULTISPECIES: hypothetical protein [unclassified Cupriavidus]|uniref:hypothetical protein n=1 Tax=unclassified Cupriavidus TaxID=2640874 RepID=UPI00313D80B0
MTDLRQPVALDQITKNDIYADLVQIGIEKGYTVIPEFRVTLPNRDGTKNLDLVWVTRKPRVGRRQDRESLQYWTLHAAFEIDACDVRNIEGKEFNRHIRDLPTIQNADASDPISHFVVLYTAAYDRAWNNDRKTVDDEIAERRGWAHGSGVQVLDGRDLSAVHAIRPAVRLPT